MLDVLEVGFGGTKVECFILKNYYIVIVVRNDS